jgi:hypothetical protein
MGRRQETVTMVLCGLLTAGTALAQERPPAIVEAVTGWAGFIDENWMDRTIVGAAGRIFLAPRIAVGPEFAYLQGAADEHDWMLTGNVTIDLIAEGRTTLQRRVVPFLAIGGGYLRQTTQVGTGPFSSSEGTVSGGLGVRLALSRSFFIAPDVRVGWEPEMRIALTLGVRPGR